MDEIWLIQRFKVAWVTSILANCSSVKWLFKGPEDTHLQPGQRVLHFFVLNLLYNILATLPTTILIAGLLRLSLTLAFEWIY